MFVNVLKMSLNILRCKKDLLNILTFRCLKNKWYHSNESFGYKKDRNRPYTVANEILDARAKNSNVYRFVQAYREHGHKKALIDPVKLSNENRSIPELEAKRYGLKDDDSVDTFGIIEMEKRKINVSEAINFLDNVYSKYISAEFMHLEQEEEREWFSSEFENLQSFIIDEETQKEIAREMLKSQEFDRFLGLKYPGLKRYGGEGAESMVPFFMGLFRFSAGDEIREIVMALPHRGRLNVLTGLLKYPPSQIFQRLNGGQDFPDIYQATGDVLSHINVSTDLRIGKNTLHVAVLKNPSHLEAVNPVSMGKTRAKQMTIREGAYGDLGQFSDKILNIQVHGDAALMGQGVNQETLNMSRAPHFEVGGSIHMVVNNQLGFTTPAERTRSSLYCTDLAKMIAAPIIHVNGDYPELVYQTTKVVFDYQRLFRKDVFLDINCYRQWGHNELDDPSFTNPLLYKIIRSKESVPNRYAEKLVRDKIFEPQEKTDISSSYSKLLSELHENCGNFQPPDPVFHNNWKNFIQAQNSITTWNTGVDPEVLTFIGQKSITYPDNFVIHKTLNKNFVEKRKSSLNLGKNIDWATAEVLAFGSLLHEGYNVRISGQDVGRGTFSHRHTMLVDQETNQIYVPLNDIHKDQKGFIEIANSILSEEAVLGFEYGFSIESPKNLCIWEAQFGDFFNGAQIPFDTFVTSGETKWLYNTGLTILLPHGYDGAGPDHSSARIERILQQTNSKENYVDGDNVNLQVCQPSTPAQYFHLLRRQMVRNFRKPLVIIAPKTLLRLPEATSNFSDMETGTSFFNVIGDQTCDTTKVRVVLFTSGRHYYTLKKKRSELNKNDTAIIRLESFSPFPTKEILEELEKFGKDCVLIWCQEEPRNMGAWTFIKPRFNNLIGRQIMYCGRETLAASAVGVAKIHHDEVADIENKPFCIKYK